VGRTIDSTDRQIAVAAGGTAGHVVAGIAIAEALRRSNVFFVGTPAGLERRLVPRAGFRLELLAGSPLLGQGVWGAPRAGVDLARGALAARRLLARRRVGLVIGTGGYASAGVLLAARDLGIPVVLHEPNARPGLTNRWLGRAAARVFAGFEETRDGFPSGSVRVSGTAIRSRTLAAPPDFRASWAAPPKILVSGGSLGSDFLDHHAPALLGRLARRLGAISVTHLTGIREPGPVRLRYLESGVRAEVLPLREDVVPLYRGTRFAIVSAGALTLAELAASGIPNLVVPLRRSARDHQLANARAFAAATGVRWVREEEWRADVLAAHVEEVLASRERWSLASKAVHAFARPDAAQLIASECETLLDRVS
jgi:UDP-N-acetylglucosamine--N-acetylmuramyl-(pentapeptide) pyrophosphoryl-undecaprenol N-acetylglucosamine transferase